MDTEENYVADEEILYRSVRVSDCTWQDGQIEISSQAFNDASREISVNRAKLRPADETRLSPTDGVVRLIAREVRDIQSVTFNGQVYQIDVRPAPIPDNPSHALIIGVPALENTPFKKLKTALKKIAEMELPPNP